MSDLSLAAGADSPIELMLLALAIVQSREGSGRGDASIHDEPIDGDALEVTSARGVTRIVSRSPSFHLELAGETVERRWFLPLNPAPAERARAGRLRLGIAGGSDSRRLRMSWRTLGELRHRNVPITAIVVGPCELSPIAGERPDELHLALAAPEYLAMLDRLDVVLDCTDSFGSESFLAVAARGRGISVVAHRDRPDLASDERNSAVMWSADGFVDALLASQHERRQHARTAADLEEILDLIEGQ